ncbi:MAG: putative Helicase [Streblomastix strix]|uniref:Putative Helicase n=1 Tax=Streblomastix strix TaxID=222440 RepID=A0A5J4WN21_9EUKA|nr:MAG: putative Helicase [Streblomastix strix]
MLNPTVFRSHSEFKDWFATPVTNALEEEQKQMDDYQYGQDNDKDVERGRRKKGRGRNNQNKGDDDEGNMNINNEGDESGIIQYNQLKDNNEDELNIIEDYNGEKNKINGMRQRIQGGGNEEQNIRPDIINRLHNVLRPFLLRRLKNDVEKQLPAKHEHVIMCKLSKRQRLLYEEFMSASETKKTIQQGNFMGLCNILMQLRKVCNHPNLFEPHPIQSPLALPALMVGSGASLNKYQGKKQNEESIKDIEMGRNSQLSKGFSGWLSQIKQNIASIYGQYVYGDDEIRIDESRLNERGSKQGIKQRNEERGGGWGKWGHTWGRMRSRYELGEILNNKYLIEEMETPHLFINLNYS